MAGKSAAGRGEDDDTVPERTTLVAKGRLGQVLCGAAEHTCIHVVVRSFPEAFHSISAWLIGLEFGYGRCLVLVLFL